MVHCYRRYPALLELAGSPGAKGDSLTITIETPATLFDSLRIRDITFKNRIAVSPMCQYSSEDGFASDWHLVHLGSRAVGGAALIFTEAASVSPVGRISPQDLGIYQDGHVEQLGRITRFIQEQGAIPGIQIGHAGRKSSTVRPWEGGGPLAREEGGWTPIFAPSPIAFSPDYQVPRELDEAGIRSVIQDFAMAAQRALAAGFQAIEIHAAHGYLLHSFLSPQSNQRIDRYGGEFANRVRLVKEVTGAIRQHWPERYPLFIRLSVTDWVEGSWDVDQSSALAVELKALGVDLIDCSSGGAVPGVKISTGAGYQTAFAARIRREAGILTGAVGLITSPQQADHILRTGQADMVLLARAMLRDPYWPRQAAHELGVEDTGPSQYERAWPRQPTP